MHALQTKPACLRISVDLRGPAGAGDVQRDAPVCRRKSGNSLRPFDETDGVGREIFAKTCIGQLGRIVQAIKIKVIQV